MIIASLFIIFTVHINFKDEHIHVRQHAPQPNTNIDAVFTVGPLFMSTASLSLAEVAAAAEMILEQDKMDCESGDGGEEEEEEEEQEGKEQSFCDSGYGGGSDESTEQK